MRVGNADASKWVIGPMPERPLTMPSQLASSPLPTGDRMPRPVMTTRRLDIAGSVSDSVAVRAPRRGGCAPETPEAASAAPDCHDAAAGSACSLPPQGPALAPGLGPTRAYALTWALM